MALTVTVAGASSDSYATVAEADAIYELSIDADWTGASTATKEAVLKRAVQIIDGGRYLGAKSDTAQALRFPSGYMQTSAGYVIPAEIKRAQCYLALEILKDPNVLEGGPSGLKIVDIEGSASVTMGGEGVDSSDIFAAMPSRVVRELRRHMWTSGPEPHFAWDPVRRTFR